MDENPPNCGYPHGDCVLGDYLTVAQTARATAEAERAHYHDLWVAACAERDRWKDLAEGRSKLLVAYRLGTSRAPEGAFKLIERGEKRLKKAQEMQDKV